MIEFNSSFSLQKCSNLMLRNFFKEAKAKFKHAKRICSFWTDSSISTSNPFILSLESTSIKRNYFWFEVNELIRCSSKVFFSYWNAFYYQIFFVSFLEKLFIRSIKLRSKLPILWKRSSNKVKCFDDLCWLLLCLWTF